MLAAEKADVAFLGLLATPQESVKETIYHQKLTQDDDPNKAMIEGYYKKILDRLFPILESLDPKETVLLKIAQMENTLRPDERIFLSVIKSKMPF